MTFEPQSRHKRPPCVLRGAMRCIVGILGILVMLGVQGCGGSSAGSSRSSGSPLVINDSIAPATLDPSMNCGFDAKWNVNFYRQLLHTGSKPGPYPSVTVTDPTKLEPDVAQSWTETSNGLQYTFHLDPKAKFTDGTPITSQAVKFTFERAIKLKSCTATYWTAESASGNVTMSTPSPTTLVVRLKQPDSMLLAAYAYPGGASILEPKIVQQHPDTGLQANPYWADHIAGGGGPFVLDQYSPGTQLTMSRNSKYTGPTPAHVQKAIANLGMSEATLLLQARSGAADVTFGLDPSDLKSLESDQAVKVLNVPVQEFYDVGLNNGMAPFNNEKVREALAYAVPYQEIVQSILYGFGSQYYGPLVPTLPGFNVSLSAPLPYDLAKAKALLAASGVKLPLTVPLVVQQGAHVPAEIAAVLQASWKPLGINVTLETLATSEYNTTVEGHKAAAFIRVDGPGIENEGWLLGYDMRCNAIGNNSSICIPRADKLLGEAEATQDQAKQAALYGQITTLWRANFPKIILAGIDNGFVLSKAVKEFYAPVIAPQEVDGISK